LDGLGKKRSCLLLLQPATWDPSARGTRGQSAAPTRTVREVRGRSGTPARMVCYLLQNIQYCPSSPRAARMVQAALADGSPGVAGQSGPLPRTVLPSFTFSAWYIPR
jgi:hypothetical protein